METDDLIRQHIRNLREAAGMSQNDMALKLKIAERNYARLERGERKQLDLQLLTAIANVLRMDLRSLLEPVLNDGERSNPKPVSTDHVLEKHYETVIAELMGIIENQRRVIEEKAQIIRESSFLQPDRTYERTRNLQNGKHHNGEYPDR